MIKRLSKLSHQVRRRRLQCQFLVVPAGSRPSPPPLHVDPHPNVRGHDDGKDGTENGDRDGEANSQSFVAVAVPIASGFFSRDALVLVGVKLEDFVAVAAFLVFAVI